MTDSVSAIVWTLFPAIVMLAAASILVTGIVVVLQSAATRQSGGRGAPDQR